MTDPTSNAAKRYENRKKRLKRYVPEVIRREPLHDAIMYQISYDTLAYFVGSDMIPRPERLIEYDTDLGNGVMNQRVPQPLPEGMDRWSYNLITLGDPQNMAGLNLNPTYVGPDYMCDVLPDIMVSLCCNFVRSNARDVIEAVDPEGSYFFPATILQKESHEPVDGDWWYWLQRRELHVVNREGLPRWYNSTMNGYCRRSHVAYELTENPAVRNFISGIPIWGLGFYVSFNREMFTALKAAGVSGLVELTRDKFDLEHYNENVGYLK